MQTFEIIHVIFYRFLRIEFHIIRTVILDHGKALINGFSPEDFALSIYFYDILTVRIDAIFVIIINQEQDNRKYIKTSVLSITIENIDNLLFGTAVTLKYFNNLFHLIQNIIVFL